MKALLITSRWPWPPHTGDRVRAHAWIEALQSRGEVTLIAPDGVLPAAAPAIHIVAASASAWRLASAALAVVRRGLPLTALLAAGRDWAGAVAEAERRHGPFDVAVVLLTRLEPWIVAHVRARRRLLDAIDALGANLDERAHQASWPASAAWRIESRRMARLEAGIARRWDRVVVVAPSECAAFGAGAVAIPHGVEIAPMPVVARTFDVAFWGRLAYFANRDAAHWLLDEIWPRVRAARPDATLLIAGADAPGFVRAADGRDGITVASPIADRRAWTSRVRVALFPVRFGTGQANKVMEAAESGCAVVSTPEGIRGLPELAAEAIVASAGAVLADVVISLLQDPVAVERAGQQLRAAVVAHYDRATAGRRLAEAAFSGLE